MLSWLTHSVSLAELQNIKRWHIENAQSHPLELQLWDAVISSWMMGWFGWFPVWILEAWWAAPALLLGMLSPRLYIGWREHAHRLHRLRCDWIELRVHSGRHPVH